MELDQASLGYYPIRVSERWSKIPWVEIGILLLAVVLRTVLLDIKPPHFDEGVNGWFADQIKDRGFYHYDPTNYHGPLHMYAVFISQTLFGRHLWALRLPAIIASVLGVGMILRFREFFGPTVVRLAALAMAVSPAFVFYGRYSIHESWMVFFAAMFLWGVLGLWEKGERRFLNALFIGATGMILTKETYLVHLVSFALASGILWLWQKVIPSSSVIPRAPGTWTWEHLAIAIVCSVFAIVFFYSGNFLDFPGLAGLYETFAAWIHTGKDSAGHDKPAYQMIGSHKLPGWLNYFWIALMVRYEWPALIGLAACARYVGKSDARLRYIAIYAGGVLYAYSIIPYKTPWCIISILWPFLLLFGAILVEGVNLFRRGGATAWLAPLIAAPILLASLGKSIWLNFYHFTDEKEPYVYVQTYPEIYIFTDPLLTMARKDPSYYHKTGQIILDSYYPLPWMLGDFTSLGYYKETEPPSAYDGDFILTLKENASTVEAGLKGNYFKKVLRLRDSQGESVAYFREGPFAEYFKGESPEIQKPAAP
ncbi:TIGR03663 family protein [soil metagenome]